MVYNKIKMNLYMGFVTLMLFVELEYNDIGTIVGYHRKRTVTITGVEKGSFIQNTHQLLRVLHRQQTNITLKFVSKLKS